MTHDEYQEMVSQYIDEELDKKNEEVLFRHLGECNQCREFFRSSLVLRSQILGTKEAAPSTLRHDFASQQTNQAVERDLLVLAWQRKVPLPVAASVAIILLAGGLFFSSMTMQFNEADQFPTDVDLSFVSQP